MYSLQWTNVLQNISLQSLKASLTDASQLLSQLHSCQERLSSRTNAQEAKTSSEDVKALQERYQSLRGDTQEQLELIESGLAQRERLQLLHTELSKWLTDVENQLSGAISSPHDDISEKKLQLERLRNIERQLQLRADAVQQLTTLAEQLDSTPTALEAKREVEYLEQRFADALALSQVHIRLRKVYFSFYFT